MKKTILVTGSSGQLGREFEQISLQQNEFEFHFANRDILNFEYEDSIRNYFITKEYDVVINCAAYTAVDKAESEEEKCYTVNARALAWLAKYVSYHSRIIHFSTDYVYNSIHGTPLREEDPTNPRGTYALSKLLGEEILKSSRSRAIVIRTSWVYSSFGHNFVNTMLRLGKTRDKLQIVSDQTGTPTYASDLAKATEKIIRLCLQNTEMEGGAFNYSNSGYTNWADFARKIFDLEKIQCTVENITTEQFNAAAPRPLWSVMDKSKIKKHFGVDTPPWDASLAKCLLELKK